MMNSTLLKGVAAGCSAWAKTQVYSGKTVSENAFSMKMLGTPSNMRSFASSKGSGNSMKSTSVKGASSKEVSKSKESNLQTVKQQLAALSAKEVQNIVESRDSQFAGIPNDAQTWLEKSGYELAETEDGVSSLSKSTKEYSIKLHFSTGEQDDEEDQMRNIRDEEDDEEGLSQSGSEGEAEDVDAPPQNNKALAFEAEILFNDLEGQPKGGIVFSGEVGEDCRVYVNELQASTTITKHSLTDTKRTRYLPIAAFDTLNQDFQDRIYDLLDEIGVDDKMGSFIRYYADNFDNKQSIEVLENIRKILA